MHCPAGMLCVATCTRIPCITLQGCSEHCNMHWDLMHHPVGMLCVATCVGTPCTILQGCTKHCNMDWDPMHHPAGLHQALQHAPGPHASPCRDAPSIATWTGTSCITLQGCCVAMSIGIPCITLQGCSEYCNVHWDPMQHPEGLHLALQHAPGPHASPCRVAQSTATCTGTSCITLQGCSVLQRALGPHASPCRDAPSIATWTETSCIALQG